MNHGTNRANQVVMGVQPCVGAPNDKCALARHGLTVRASR